MNCQNFFWIPSNVTNILNNIKKKKDALKVLKYSVITYAE